VQRSLRIPEEWLERLGLVTVKFAVGKDGAPSRFQSLSQGFAERAGPAIWRAVRSCRWIPGADDQGRTAAIWVVLPIRFTVE
jgi:protein TonB